MCCCTTRSRDSAPVTDFIKQAASDPQVLAIKQTLYRAGSDSTIVGALVEAAQAGKDVTVIIELRARFDEEANIELATKLQEAGAHVMYGVFGFKTHAKLVMVVRREEKGLRRYCHLGTGNYHAKTARLYTDYGLHDRRRVDRRGHPRDIPAAHRTHARAEAAQAAARAVQPASGASSRRSTAKRSMRAPGEPARIIAKLNALTEPTIIQALYRASRAGVEIDLIVRGVCCLRPGVRGVSDRIRVRSIVGRFLEHSRVYYFENAGAREIYCGSADWMDRNLFRRIEVAFPIESAELQARVADDLKLYLEDDMQAWVLNAEGEYARAAGDGKLSAQARLMTLLRRAHGAHRSLTLDDAETKTGVFQIQRSCSQILESERMLLDPALRQFQRQTAALGAQAHLRQRLRAAAAVQQHREAQQHDQKLRQPIPRRQQILERFERQLAAVTADQRRQQQLLLAREARHVGILEQVGAVAVVFGVRDIEAGFVQTRRPAQHRLRQRIFQSPLGFNLFEQGDRGHLDAFCLGDVDVIAFLHGAHAAHARILVGEPPHEIVEQSFAHRALGYANPIDAEVLDHFQEDREARGKHRRALGVNLG